MNNCLEKAVWDCRFEGEGSMVEKQKTTLQRESQEEIKQLKKRIKDLENERDILLALHRRDTDWEK